MHSGPPATIERVVGWLIPPASREEVLGDLHERHTSRTGYLRDALITVPMVIASRIRRTSDGAVVLLELTVLYLSFLCAAWLFAPSLLSGTFILFRATAPAFIALAGIVLDDAYANPGYRPIPKSLRGLVAGLAAACVFQVLPSWATLGGCALSLIIRVLVRIVFPPLSNRPVRAAVPASWLKHSNDPVGIWTVIAAALRVAAAGTALALLLDALGLQAHPAPFLLGFALIVIALEARSHG